jgi:hypothetical protein
VIDVEPMVTPWDTDHAALATGVERVIDLLATAGLGLTTLAFATNSLRELPSLPERAPLAVSYRAGARKPTRTATYRELPRPGVVIGDQVLTDGLLAWRLGYTFLHFRPDGLRRPVGPRLMHLLGVPLGRLLFTRS